MTRTTTSLLILLLIAPLDNMLWGQTESTSLSGPDVFNVSYADSPCISPDGRWISYTHVKANRDNDRFERSFALYDTTVSDLSTFQEKYSFTGKPAWTSDSRQFAISARLREQHFIALFDAGGRKPTSLIPTDAAAEHLTWSRDNEQLIYGSFVKKPQERLVKLPAKEEVKDWAPPVIEIDRTIYRRDGKGYLRHGNTQLFHLDVASKTITQLTSDKYDHPGPYSWIDEAQFVFAATLYEGWEHEPRNDHIYLVDVPTKTVSAVTNFGGVMSHPSASPSGNSVAFLGYVDKGNSYQQTDLHVLNLDSGNIVNHTREFDRSINSHTWLDEDTLYLQFDDHGVGKIGSLALSTHEMTEQASDVGGISIGRPYQGGTFSVSVKGDLVFPEAALDRPAEIALIKADNKQLISNVTTELTRERTVCPVERFTYKSSFDNRPIDGWAVFPPDFNRTEQKNYPLILEIHGGPFANYGSRFAMEPQLYASLGFIVVYSNPRGSTGYGEEFAQLIDKDYPQEGDFQDLMSAVDYSIEHFQADEDRLYVTGGSGGGILTAWLVCKTDRFKAAISQKPVINWETLAYTSDGYLYFTKYWFDGTPTQVPEEYSRRSPLSYVDKVTTPTMLMTGEQDWRTPITEAEQFYQGLKLNKVDTVLIRVPDSSHSIAARPSRIWMKVNYVNAWFNKYR